MLASLRRAVVVVSLVSTLLMFTSGLIGSDLALPGDGRSSKVTQKALTALRAVEFTFRGGLARLTINKDGHPIYIARYDLNEASQRFSGSGYARFAIIFLALWVVGPVARESLKVWRRRRLDLDRSRPSPFKAPPLELQPASVIGLSRRARKQER